MADEQPASGRQMLVARVGGRLIGLRASAVVRILPMVPLWRPPTLPMPLRGFLSVEGRQLPVISARAVLGLGEEAPPSVYAHILQLDRIGGRPAGLLVDRAEGLTTPATLGPLDESGSLNGCAIALFGYEGEIVRLIEPDRLLGAAEAAALAALAAEAERRRDQWAMPA